MKINLEHKFGRLILETTHNDPDKKVSPTIKIEASSEEFKKSIKLDWQRETEYLSGFYGHLVDINLTTNLDLGAAVRQLSSFKIISIEPEIKPNPLPEGAVS